jgi:hypothetical protein
MQSLFETFTAPLIGMPVSHVWRGYGSALFLEFGRLHSTGDRRDGSPRNPDGEMGLMIGWSWRIERPRSILCGSWSEETRWPKAFEALIGSTVINLETFARLPEIAVGFSNGLHVASFMTAEGQPDWALFDRRTPDVCWLTVRGGRLTVEKAADFPRGLRETSAVSASGGPG